MKRYLPVNLLDFSSVEKGSILAAVFLKSRREVSFFPGKVRWSRQEDEAMNVMGVKKEG